MFNNTEYQARKERFNTMVRDSQHYQLVQSIEAEQPGLRARFMTFVSGLWGRRPHLKTSTMVRESEVVRSQAANVSPDVEELLNSTSR